jgi:arsenate reductase (thioredoxin)
MMDPLRDMAVREVDRLLDQVAAPLAIRLRGVFSPQTGRTVRLLRRPVLPCPHPPAPAGVGGELRRRTAHRDGEVQGRIGKPVPEVLFLCVYNAGRSQLRHSRGRVLVHCAGSHPADWLDENILEALGEWGIEVLEAYPKPMTADMLRASDVIVTMGCGDACPILPGKRFLDWEMPDPPGRDMPFAYAASSES